jgi:CBS domain-containing protein
MQTAVASTENPMQFKEPVKSLLRKKGPAVWSISPEASVYEAIEQMSERHVGALVVLTAGHLAGIVSERDYARKVILKGRHSHDTRVREIMSTPVLFVTPETAIDECMRMMTARRVRHLPVLEGERVVGMLSMGDVVNWLLTSYEQTIQHLQNYISGAYPG